MAELSTYSLESLHNDGGLVLYRGRRDYDPCQILVSIPQSRRPALELLKRLEREDALRLKLDPAWAVLPVALIRESEQTALALQDPGGEPLDRMLGQPPELREFLRIAIGLAAAVVSVHERGIIHKDIKPANVMVDLKSERVWLMRFG